MTNSCQTMLLQKRKSIVIYFDFNLFTFLKKFLRSNLLFSFHSYFYAYVKNITLIAFEYL